MQGGKRVCSSDMGPSSDKCREACYIFLGWKEEMMGNLFGKLGRVVKKQSFGGERR